MRLSIEESNKLAEIYANKVLVEDMTAGDGGVFGDTGTGDINDLENGDDYAPGDNRIPFIMGVQSRKGPVKKKKGKKKKKLPFLGS